MVRRHQCTAWEEIVFSCIRTFATKAANVDPLACSPYSNILVMMGTNDFINNTTDAETCELDKLYKLEITQILHHNPNANILVCPVLHTNLSSPLSLIRECSNLLTILVIL